MKNEELRMYVVSERARGVQEGDIKSSLLAKGWKDEDVNDVMTADIGTIASVLPGTFTSGMDLLKKTVDDIGAHFSLIIPIVALPAILLALPGIAKEYNASLSGTTLLLVSISAIAGGVLSVLASIGLMKEMRSGWTLTVEETYSASTRYFWSTAWVALLTGLVVIGGMILLIVPGIIISGLIAFGRNAVVLEGKKGIDALSYSAELVTGFWWDTFLRYLMLAVPYILVAIVFRFIPYANQLTSLITLPFSVIYSVHLYDALKVAHPVDPASTIGKRKGMFIGLAVFGLIAIPLMIFVLLGLLSSSHMVTY